MSTSAEYDLLVIAHHGSPGSPRDFKVLKRAVSKYGRVKIFAWQRWADESSYSHNGVENFCHLGYSWGAKIAIEQCAQDIRDGKHPSALVLVAPYIFRSQAGPSLFQKVLLHLPLLGKSVLKKVGPKSINEHLEKCAYPSQIPSELSKLAHEYSRPENILASLMEKNNKSIDADLELIRNSGVPVVCYYGDQDKVSSRKDQIESLQSKLPDMVLNSFEDAGHALLWTHAKEIALYLCKDVELTKIGYEPESSKDNNIATFLKRHRYDFPEREILKWVDYSDLAKWDGNLDNELPHRSVTVAELDHLVAVLGAEFKKIGIKSGDKVIIFVPMSLALYASMFALQKIGAVAVFLDSWARRDQLGVSAKVADPTAIISLEQAFNYLATVPEIEEIKTKIVVGPHSNQYDYKLEDLMSGTETAPRQAVEQEHTALITFTTGSSGTPKGADRSHRFLCAQHYALNRHIPYEESDSDLPAFPIFSLNNLAAGVTTVIPAIDLGTPSDKDPLILIAQMKSQNVTCTTLSPSLMRNLSAYCLKEGIVLSFLKRIVTGGAPVSNDDVRQAKAIAPNAEVLVLYGSTEVEPMAHIEAEEMLANEKSDDSDWVDRGVMVGEMDEGLETRFLKIIDGPVEVSSEEEFDSLCVAEGSVGEIIVSGEHVCERYYNNDEAFKKSKIVDPQGRIWHRTGDLGYQENGKLWLVGRVHNAIRRADEYYFPVRSEIAMKKLDFVQKCAYLGLPDQDLHQRTAAVFSLKEDYKSEVDDRDFKQEILRIMDKNQIVVDDIILVDDIPMDPRHHSKVEYGVLREMITQ